MSVINLVSAPPPGSDVFSPMIYEFAFSESSASFVEVDGGIASIYVALTYASFIEVGDKIRITNGAYLGTYTVTAIDEILMLRLTLNTPYIGSSAATGSNSFTPEGLADFQLIAGYSTGPEALIKPWQIIDEIRVSPNLTSGAYCFDVSGFLQSRFAVTPPVLGPDVPISIRYAVRLKTATAIPNDAGALTAYYGLADLTAAQQSGDEAVGERPILFFGDAPVLYSLALDKGIINNFIADPDAVPVPAAGAVLDVRLLSCQPRTLNWIGTAPTVGFTTTPALPSWIQATARGNGIDIIINPCSAGVGDYLATDYDPLDYLTGGQVNSVIGCFSYAFNLGGLLFTLGVCVTPISEIIEVCPDALNFAWLNQRGGFSSMALDCRYLNGRDFGGDSTVLGSNSQLKRVEFTDVYDTVSVSGGVLGKNQLEILASLRSSIQAFLFNTATQAWDIPIVLDKQNFSTYGNRFNQSETRFSFRFRKAQRVEIQTQ